MMSLQMPPELTDHVIDFLWDSPADLQACSFVCRQWLPSTRHHLFQSITIRPDARFLTLLRSPWNVVANHTRTLDFRLWPATETTPHTSHILSHLQCLLRLRTIIIGSFPPSPKTFLAISWVTKVSLQHTKFASNTEFALFLSKFTGLRELELAWVTWEDTLSDDHDHLWPYFPLGLDALSVQGLQQNPDVLRWLSCAEYAPLARGISFYIPHNADNTCLFILSKFLLRHEGHLRSLHLDLYPSPYIQRILMLLELNVLTSLRRLRLGHGVYFHPQASDTAATPSTCRIFPAVLELAPLLGSRNQLEELIFEVDVSSGSWTSSSVSSFNKFLGDPILGRIPMVRFLVIRGNHSGDVAAGHRRKFEHFMRERGFVGRNIVYSGDSE